VTTGDLTQLADSLARASREYSLAVAAGDEVAARSLGVALRKLESLIAAAAQEWHHSEGC